MSTEENKAIARRWVEEIWDKGSVAAMDELLAANFVFNYAAPGGASDREGYERTVTMYHTVSPDMHYAVDDIVTEGDKVAVRWTGQGTHKGDLMGIAPTGKQVTITGISILRIAGGKIVEEWGEMNLLGALQELGTFPPPSQA